MSQDSAAVRELTPTLGGVTHTASQSVPRPGAMPTAAAQALAAKDKTLTSAACVEMARAALGEISGGTVGEYVAAVPEGERLVTHLFDCTMPGYRGWRWAATVSRPLRGRTATVCEMGLLPGEDALLAPTWVPWAERLEPGDVARTDRLPRRETDERLEPGWEATGDDADAIALDELDLGRPRVLSSEGVSRAAQRWYDGDHGPGAEGVRSAHATCSTCGFFLPMAGSLRAVFGVCANEWAADDGTVVSLDHGCGAHSETDLPDQGPEWPITPSRVDDHSMEAIGTDGLGLRQGVTLAEQQESAAEEDRQEAPPSPEPGTSPAPAQDDSARAERAERSGRARRAGSAQPAAREAQADAEETTQEAAREAVQGDSQEEGVSVVAQPAGEPAEPDEPAEGPAGEATEPAEVPAGAEASDSGAQDAEDRAASARAAVADLSASLTAGTASRSTRPQSLADLEAALPQR